jgi:YceI-like protein
MRRGVVAGRLAVFGAILFAGLFAGLTACVTRQVVPPAPGAPAARLVPSPLLGRPFDVIPSRSRLILLVYRAGPMAALGHNHVIACRCLTGTVYLPRDPLHASFDLRVAVTQLTVDDPALRAAEHSADFPADVPQSARQGTRHNMLGAALLDAAEFPDITLRAEGLRRASDGGPHDMLADVLVQTRGQARSITVPVRYDIEADEIVVTGKFPLRQTDLGLTPFSALGGALEVRDGMEVRLRLVARRRARISARNDSLKSRQEPRLYWAPSQAPIGVPTVRNCSERHVSPLVSKALPGAVNTFSPRTPKV